MDSPFQGGDLGGGERKGITLNTGEALTPTSLVGKGAGGLGLSYIF